MVAAVGLLVSQGCGRLTESFLNRVEKSTIRVGMGHSEVLKHECGVACWSFLL